MPKTTVVEIIYKDEDIVVINKPSGISVTADRSGDADLLDILAEQLKAHCPVKLRLIHRLDKQTSGVMILAKNAQAQSQFSGLFEHKRGVLANINIIIDDHHAILSAFLRVRIYSS